jgi:hypothetical protein
VTGIILSKILDSENDADLADFYHHITKSITDDYNLDTTAIEQVDINRLEQLIKKKMDLVYGKPGLLPLKKHRILVRALIAKWCFKEGLKNEVMCEECVDDFSSEFARQSLIDEDASVWVEYWAQQRPQKKISSVFIHKPAQTFSKLAMLAGNDIFKDIVRELLFISRSRTIFCFEEYLTFLRTRLRRVSAPLDSTEVKIVDYVVNNEASDLVQIGKVSGITTHWASRKLSELIDRSILRKYERVPFSKIGIRMFNLFLNTVNTEEDPYRLLARCPFLYSYSRVLTGTWSAHAVLCVPDNFSSINSIGHIESVFKKWGIASSLREIASSGIVNCFDYYDSKNGTWEIPWEVLGLELERIHSEKLAPLMPRIDTPTNRTRMYLDDLHMKILAQIRAGNTSIKGIRESLRVGQQRVADRLKELRVNEIIVTSWEAHNIGLFENAIVVSDDFDAGSAIGAWSLRLPKAILSYDINKTMSLVTRLPKGGSYGLASALRCVIDSSTVGLLDNAMYGAWGFPVNLWNTEKQQWDSPRTQTENWLEELR